MNWNAYIDAYCERLLPGFWGEPLNAASNLAFWLSAWLVWRIWRTATIDIHDENSLLAEVNRASLAIDFVATPAPRQQGRWDINSLLLALVLIGAGSFAFHTFATRWAAALDVLFIALYLHLYLAVYAHRVLGVRWPIAWLGVPAFVVLSQSFALLWGYAATLTGSALLIRASAASGYLAALTVLLVLLAHSASKRLPSAAPLAAAAACFAISLTLRQLDIPLCSDWRWGTHFGWHVLNACTLGLTSWAMVRMARDQKSSLINQR